MKRPKTTKNIQSAAETMAYGIIEMLKMQSDSFDKIYIKALTKRLNSFLKTNNIK